MNNAKRLSRRRMVKETSAALAALGLVATTNDVQTVVIPGAGHWVAETAPEEMLMALGAFLAPYRAAA